MPDLAGDLDANSAFSLQGFIGNAGITDLIGGVGDWWSGARGEDEAPPPGQDRATSSEPTAPSVTAAKRRVVGGGGYVYEQFADGTIMIVEGPGGGGTLVEAGTAAHAAITAEIGPFVADGKASPESTAVEGSGEEAGQPHSTDAAAGEQGWLDWMGSSARKLADLRQQYDPRHWVAQKAGEAVSTWWGGDERSEDPEHGGASVASTGGTGADQQATGTGRRKPSGVGVQRSGEVPTAARAIEGNDAIEIDSLLAAEGYLPRYDGDGKLVSGIGTYGFHQSDQIRDAEARQWEDGMSSSTPVEEGSETMKVLRAGYTSEEAKRAGTEKIGMTEMWCSGLSSAVLSDLGYSLDDPIPNQFYWENGKQKSITMRMVVEGMPEIMAQSQEMDEYARGIRDDKRAELATEFADAEAMPEETKAEKTAKRTRLAELESVVQTAYVDALYSLEGTFGETAAKDSLLVKGGAGAIELALLGREVASLSEVRPGDFCQWRNRDSARGHAFQVHSVVARGAMLAGLPGSPEIVGQAPEAEPGATIRDVTFRITPKTNPNTVLTAMATEWSVIESNLASAQRGLAVEGTGEKADREGDGGVAITEDHALPETPDATKRYYVGRLSASPWYASLGRVEA